MSTAVSHLSRADRLRLVRQRPLCWACGHGIAGAPSVVPLVAGVDAPANLVALCPSCAAQKPPLMSLADAALWRERVRAYGAQAAALAD